MKTRTLTVVSGALLLLAANAFVRVAAQEATAEEGKPAEARAQSEERDALEPAVSEPVPSAEQSATEQDAAEQAAAASAASAPATAQGASSGTKFRTVDRIELESTAITGNRELPKVLYIVPWKKADLGDLVGRPANSLLDEVLTPVDREVFRRQTEYFSRLDTVPAGGAPQTEQKTVPAPPPR